MKDMKSVFFGTPRFAVDVLEELEKAGIMPSLIVTAPDAPRGRGLTLTPSEVKVWAEAHDIPVLCPQTLRQNGKPDPDRDVLYNSEWDLFLLASYGKILPQSLLDLPAHGTLNVHPSLLPRYRGPSPVRTGILDDARDAAGVTIMLLDAGMDTGPIIAQTSIKLEPSADEWPPSGTAFERLLAHEGGKLLAEVTPLWLSKAITPEVQDESKATYSKMLTKEMGLLDLSGDPYQNYLKYRALDGWPGTYFFVVKKGKQIRVKVTEAEWKDGTFNILKVIPEGKQEMRYQDFLR